ncbi:MAG: hypothetical protein ACXVA9_05875 [Bdellovibrionales bacterium]
MRFLILTLPAMLAFNLHAETAAIPLAVDAQATEFTTRVDENTGNIELQKADGTWQLVAIKNAEYSENENVLPVVKVQYYGYGAGYAGYGYGYDCPPGYVPPVPVPPPCYNCGVAYAPPIYYPAPVPQVYYGGQYYGPNRYWRGGGYGYNHWGRRW